MQKIIRNGIIMVLALGILAGCQGMAPKVAKDYEADSPILMQDKFVRKDVAVSKHRASWTADGRLAVDVVFVSRNKKETVKMQVQTIFKDADGFETEKTNWQLVMIAPQGFAHYTSKALNTKAKGYNIYCRTAQ